LIAAASLALMAVSCEDQPEGVEVGEVGRADVVEVVDAPATVTAAGAATLTAVADGTLDELWVEPGEEVERGDVLAVIDSPEAERRLDEAEEALAAADQAVASPVSTELGVTQDATDQAAAKAFDEARDAAERIADEELREALLAQVDAAEETYQAAASAAREAVRAVQQGVESLGSAVTALGAAQRLQAEQAYELAKATVDELTLRAPFDGVVQLGGTSTAALPSDLSELLGGAPLPTPPAETPVGVEPVPVQGGTVTAGTAVATVVDVSELGLVAEVDETDVLLVEPGVAAQVELDAAPGVGYTATVSSVDLLPTATERGGVAYRVRLALADAEPVPRPGMSAVAHLRVREARGTIAVPAAAVLRVGTEDVVWAVRDGRVTRVPVTVGVQGVDMVEIVSGLQPGERIVVRGADLVSEGDRL
jgi:HlyD family secretion protein